MSSEEKALSKDQLENAVPEIEPITAEEVEAAKASAEVATPAEETPKEEIITEAEIKAEPKIEKPASVVLPPSSMTKIPSTPPTLSVVQPENKLLKWWVGLFQKMSSPVMPQTTTPSSGANPFASTSPPLGSAKDEAKNRLQLVLMHDRTRLSPTLLESMRDELVEVISKYVEIDKSALDLSLEQEADTIALVANISVVRTHRGDQEEKASV